MAGAAGEGRLPRARPLFGVGANPGLALVVALGFVAVVVRSGDSFAELYRELGSPPPPGAAGTALRLAEAAYSGRGLAIALILGLAPLVLHLALPAWRRALRGAQWALAAITFLGGCIELVWILQAARVLGERAGGPIR